MTLTERKTAAQAACALAPAETDDGQYFAECDMPAADAATSTRYNAMVGLMDETERDCADVMGVRATCEIQPNNATWKEMQAKQDYMPAARMLPKSAMLQHKLDAYQANGAIALRDGNDALVFSARGVEQLTPRELMDRDDCGVAYHGTTCAGGWIATESIQIEISAAAKLGLPTLQDAIARHYYDPSAMRRAEQLHAQRAVNYVFAAVRPH